MILLEPPATNQYGNMRQFGSIGSYKADIAYPPIDLMKIAGYLNKLNIESTIYDANSLRASIEDVIKLIKKKSPRLLLFTTSTTAINKDMEVAQETKKISKDIITATFGAHIKGAPVQTLKQNTTLDVAIYGDPEIAVKEIVRNNYNLSKVSGIYYKKNNEIIKNNPHPAVTNLDEYGIAAHDMIRQDLYHDPFSKRSPLTITYGQIGCINSCNYCMSTLYGKLRMRSVSHFITELTFIERLGFKEVFFIDCGFTNNLRWASLLLDEMIKKPLDLTWWCLSRADHLNQNILLKMKAAGCHSVGIGVESVNPLIIEKTGKGVDPSKVLKTIETAKKIGIKVLLYFQFGLPGETKKSMQETLDYALKSGADLVTFGIATPVPGTKFYEYIQKNKFFITNDWSKFDPTLPPVFNYPNLSSNDIFEFSQKAYKDFYMRPSYILNRFIKQRSLQDIKNNFGNFFKLIQRVM